MSTDETNAKHVDMTSTDYHAHPAIGASMLECFRESRRTYYARYVEKSEPAPEPSAAMVLGTLVHLMLLEPERFPQSVADPYPETAPDGKNWLRRKGSDHERWWAEEVAKRDGKIPCDVDLLSRLDRIVKSIRGNERAAKLLAQEGKTEFTILWRDKHTGLDCKCRVDFMPTSLIADPRPVAVDLKTTDDPAPQPYASSLVRLGYHRKLKHYQAGLNAYTGSQQPFVHIAAGTCPPYAVASYDIDDRHPNDGFPLGAEQRRRTLRNLAECIESNDWREPWEKSVVTLSLPSWAFSEEAYQF